jgi:hypothetical protein
LQKLTAGLLGRNGFAASLVAEILAGLQVGDIVRGELGYWAASGPFALCRAVMPEASPFSGGLGVSLGLLGAYWLSDDGRYSVYVLRAASPID